jgi:cell division cycle protein 20 (cofactor of APC complex)
MEHVYNAIQLYLSNEVPREVVEYTTTARLWKKLRTFNMIKSLINQLYLKHLLCTLQIKKGMSIKEHLNEFNRVILYLWNDNVRVENKDHDLILLCSLPLFYDHFIHTFL